MNATRHDKGRVTQSPIRAITSRHWAAMRTTAAVLLVASAAGWSTGSSAQTIAATELPLTKHEQAFWACDHAATTGLIDSGTAITCSSLTETLKHRTFGGDFKAMLAWWLQHKDAEHLALAAKTGGLSPARLTPDVKVTGAGAARGLTRGRSSPGGGLCHCALSRQALAAPRKRSDRCKATLRCKWIATPRASDVNAYTTAGASATASAVRPRPSSMAVSPIIMPATR